MKFIKRYLYIILVSALSLLANTTISSPNIPLSLSQNEIEWLSNHPIVRVGMDPDYAPFEWLDEKGEHTGMVVEYLKIIEKKLGIHFEIMKNTSWSEAIEMAKRSEIDLLTSIVETPERLKFLVFSEPYRDIQTIIVDNEKGSFIGSPDALKHKRVAVEKGYFTEELITTHYPDVVLVPCNTTLEALTMVSDDKVDAYVGDISTTNYTIMKYGIQNLRFSGQADFLNQHRFGVTKENAIFAPILSKAMNTISPEEADAIFSRWTSIRIEQGIKVETLATYGTMLAFFLFLLMYWTYRLKREIAYRKLLEAHERVQKNILEMVATAQPLFEILDALIKGVEEQNQGALCSIVLIDTATQMPIKVIAPHLPDFYNKAVMNVKMEYGAGSCGTAIATKQRFIAEDVANHPYWQYYKEIVSDAGIASAWSEPILSSGGDVFGTFAIYHHKVQKPTKTDLLGIEQNAYLASIAIEKSLMENKLKEREAYYRQLTEDVSDVIWKVDTDLILTYISPADERLRGYKADEVIGHHIFEMFTQEGIKILSQKLAQRAEAEKKGTQTGEISFEIEHVCKDGSLLWGEIISKPERNEAGEIIGYHGITREITERKIMQAKVEKMAFYDALTSLPNRLLLSERFKHAVEIGKRSKKYSALLFLDLDNFKSINDMFGHGAGDKLLIEVANRIKQCVRTRDTVSRLGGDEFVVILEEINEDKNSAINQVQVIAEKIRHSLATPYQFNTESKIEYCCTISIGILIFKGANSSFESVLKKADKAMYQAKEAGKNRIHLYESNN